MASRTTAYSNSRRSRRSFLRLAALPGGVEVERPLGFPDELKGTVASIWPKPELSTGADWRLGGFLENQFKSDILITFSFDDRKSVCQLLTNAKFRENHTQQVVRSELTRDFAQSVLRQTQFFGQQVQRLVLGGQVLGSTSHVGIDTAQGLHVALSRDEHAATRSLPARSFQQGVAQRIQAHARLSR